MYDWKDLYHRIQFTEHNWPITSGREHLSNPLIRVSGHGSVVQHVVVLACWLCHYEGLFGLCKVITASVRIGEIRPGNEAEELAFQVSR